MNNALNDIKTMMQRSLFYQHSAVISLNHCNKMAASNMWDQSNGWNNLLCFKFLQQHFAFNLALLANWL